ncbi:glycosyltransferase [Serinicoccus sp. CUA-874]|uniref:glycosyltransferase n=1 Tax=Serinicoccus sp. CUA-874 TaxID=1517939 RepID=UPI00130115B1|nr:glycosyltransferase [Serinicoccus sp. CUA-874]
MTIRVRQIPAGHAYVAALLPVRPDPRTEPAVVHLPDPPVPGAPPGEWWPHPALDPAWLREHASEQDLVHVHFGLEGQDTARLRTWLEMLREQRLPLVHTVHDLDHPQLRDQRRHREHLELLVEHAAGLLTLTEGAAEVVQRTLGRRPLVVPHPHVAPLPLVGRPRPARSGPLTVGLHLKSLRANLAPLRSLPALAAAVREVDSVLPSAPGSRCAPTPRCWTRTGPVTTPGWRGCSPSWVGRPGGSSTSRSPRGCRTTSSGTTCAVWTCPCCPTPGPPTPAGSRPAATWGPGCWRPRSGTCASRGACCRGGRRPGRRTRAGWPSCCCAPRGPRRPAWTGRSG